jgi:hypothetical protein
VTCTHNNRILVQLDLDIHYKIAMESIMTMIKVSYVGVVEAKNRLNGGIMFLDRPMETITHRRLSLRSVPTIIMNTPVVITGVMPRSELGRSIRILPWV